MIITRTPFRVSFFGGGTDYPAWYEEHGGAVISAALDKYCYLNVRRLPPFFDYNYRVRYAKNENAKTIHEIEHPSVRECLKHMGLEGGVEIQHTADLPAMSGLGSSSAFTVGLLHALHILANRPVTMMQLALDAIHVEQDLIGESVGSQDQVAAAFGNFNKIGFSGHHTITVEPVELDAKSREDFQDYLMLFFTGFSRMASTIAADKIKNIPKNHSELRELRKLVDEAMAMLQQGDFEDFGALLRDSWNLKRKLSPLIATSAIDEMYERGIKAGALGGKLLGAGGGGFMLFFVKPEMREKVREALREFLYVPFRFDEAGSRVIYSGSSDDAGTV